MESIALASTTFVGQNLGSGQPKRAKRSILIASCLAMACTAVLIVAVIYPFAPHLVAFFNSKEAVVEYGTLFLYWISPFFLLNCINQIYACGLRGAGNTKAPMVMLLCSFVGFRQLYLFIVANYISNTVIPIAMGYPAGWFVASMSMLIYYRFTDFEKYSVIKA
jgi:Na+-driven multidrug efflux pump